MPNPNLHEHQTRVDEAEKILREDLQRLALWSRTVRRRVGTGKVLLLLGGATVLGIVAMRAAYRRQQRIVVRTAVPPRAPGLFGTALRMALIEATRLAATRFARRLPDVFERRHVPRLAGAPVSTPGGIDRRGA